MPVDEPCRTTSEASSGNRRRLVRAIQAAAGEGSYASYHAPRYAVVVDLLRRHLRRRDGRLLDVGRSPLTDLLHRELSMPVDSLGFAPDGETTSGRHYDFDLNDTQWRERWRTDLPRYEVVVLAEVLEHLHTAPTLVLGYLGSLLASGGILVLQTPNALALPKRLKPLLGRHPYEAIREDWRNPGHFRESTMGELRDLAGTCGFEILHAGFYNYFDLRHGAHTGSSTPRWLGAVKWRLYGLLPGPLRPGITMVLRRVADSAHGRV